MPRLSSLCFPRSLETVSSARLLIPFVILNDYKHLATKTRLLSQTCSAYVPIIPASFVGGRNHNGQQETTERSTYYKNTRRYSRWERDIALEG